LTVTDTTRKEILKAQRNEITEYFIYTRLADSIPDEKNAEVLRRIGEDERRHAEFWSQKSGVKPRPKRFKIFRYYWISRILGLVFGIKLMERAEDEAQINYERLTSEIPESKGIRDEEEEHEDQLVNMLKEERLDYMGSVVLGLNDALVELTGALAGLTFALRNPQLIAVAGLITGIAASFSMGASEYLSQKSEGNPGRAFKSALYTGVAYIFTVAALILPYLLFINPFIALPVSLGIAVIIIASFNFYISVAQDLDFGKRFWEMTLLSFGVAGFSFLVGIIIRSVFGIDV
jgi:vacuolar iron transporter family protein